MKYNDDKFRNTTRLDYKDYAFDDLRSSVKKYEEAIQKDNDRYEKEKKFLLNKYAPTVQENTAGIYGVKVDNKFVYIGQSTLLTGRIISHIYSIMEHINLLMLDDNIDKKYGLLSQAVLSGYKIEFVVLCECDKESLKEEEKHYIKLYNPPLNIQHTNNKYVPVTLEQMLNPEFDVTVVRSEIRNKYRTSRPELKEKVRIFLEENNMHLNEIADKNSLSLILEMLDEK